MDDSEFHPVTLASDTTDLTAGPISRMADAVTQGIPAAAMSGGLSIWNTIVDYGNGDKVNVQEAITKADANWGDYYKEHTDAVDMAGFIGTSFIPGALGVKALKMAAGGNALGPISRGLGLASSKRALYLEQAIKETAESGGVIKGILSSARRKQLIWETADAALLGAASELAIAATMHDSTVFDNQSAGDLGVNAGIGAAVAGLIGGPLASIGVKGILKNVQTEVDFAKRTVDTVFDPNHLGLSKGTETLLFAESLAKLPEDFMNIPFTYRYDGVTKSVVGGLPTEALLRDTRTRAAKTAEQQLALKFNELAEGNAAIGQGYFDFVRQKMIAAKEAGSTPDDVVGLVNGYLSNVTKLEPIDFARIEQDSTKFYVALTPSGLDDMFSVKRVPGKTGKSAYRVAEGVKAEDLSVVNLADTGFPSLRAAWRGGLTADIVMMPNGRAAINPNSEAIRRLAENPNKVRMFHDLATGTQSEEAIVHFADTIKPGRLVRGPSSISAGTEEYRQAAVALTDISKSAASGSARFAWAAGLGIKDLERFTGGTIQANDLALLSRWSELSTELGSQAVAKINIVDGATTYTINDLVSPTGFLTTKKYEVLASELGKGTAYDLRHIAAHVNASPDFVEEAITRNFQPARTGTVSVPDLPTSDALRPKTVVVEWNFAQVSAKIDPIEAYKQQFGPAFQATAELGRQYQLKIRQVVNDAAFASVMGADAAKFWDSPADLAKQSTQGGAGAGIVTSSNADYGAQAKLWVQDTGKNVMLVSQKLRDEAIETISPAVNALRGNKEASAELGIITNALRKSEFRYVFEPGTDRLISTEVVRLMAKEEVDADTAIAMLASQAGKPRVPHKLELAHVETADFLRAHTELNTARQNKFTVLHNATGLSQGPVIPGTVYVPPVNTVKYPYHAFVRTKEQLGVASDVTMITAKSEEQLQNLIKSVDTGKYDVHYKKDTEMYFKAKGEYDYSMTLNESRINSEMTRTGKMADAFPETKLENIMEDYLQFHSRQSEKLVRTSVQVKNRQFFSEMQFLSDNYRAASESMTRSIGASFKSKVADPFGDYIKTALNVSKQQEFPLLDSLNEFVDRVGLKAGEAIARARDEAQKGTVSWQEADAISARFGLGTPYAEATDHVQAYIAANSTYPKNIIRESFQKANMMLANFTLRLDFANSLVNILSTPIMLGTELQSIKGLVANDSVLAGKLAELRSVQVPGQAYRAPSSIKLMGNSINNFFGADKDALLQRYRDIGAVKDVSKLYHEMLDDLSFDSAMSPNHWYNKVNGAVDKMANFTGNNWSEDFTRFMSADVMRQLSDPVVAAGKMTVKEQNAYISTFVNRVQGNYVTSQRPVVFQGTTGAAVSLFQTYAFNVLQQLHRHTEAGDKRTLAVFAGLQSTVFGLNGLPFFDAVNTHLIGSQLAGNPEHKDAYSVLPGFNKDLGDWMLYGTASAFPLFSGSSPALYTRGDINPRHLSVLPTNIVDVPAVSASIKLATTVYDFGKNVGNGVDMSDAMLLGLEHQGINRPLAGFAQLLAGRSVTSKGTLISAANDMQATSMLGALAERAVEYGGVSRLLGARPMDEAVALNNIYRNKTYEALDKARLANLGGIVKAKLYGGETPTSEELHGFMEKYAAAGGRIENFNQFMQRSLKDANVSTVNQVAAKLNSSTGRKLSTIMGGEQLPDYSNALVTPSAEGEIQ